jgi:6-phosphogluconolactonase
VTSHLVLLGTYTRPSPTGNVSKGIYAVRLDSETGALGEPALAAETANPTWLTLSRGKKFLYAAHASKTQAIGFAFDAATARLTPLPISPQEPASSSCHLAVDVTGRMLLAANYGDGYVTSAPIRPDGTLGPPAHIQHTGRSVNPKRQDKPHVHSVTISPDNRHVIVCDLGLDKIFSYALDLATAKLSPSASPFVAVAPGSGPRHFAFGADGRHGYGIDEMGGTISVYDYDAACGGLSLTQTISTLPPDFTGEKWNAEVRVHPNGHFVYGSSRTHDSLAVFSVAPVTGRLTLIEIVPSGGKTPRNFALSPDGRWLLCAHQDSDNLTVFRVDLTTGRLTRTPHSAKVPMCVCVLFYD